MEIFWKQALEASPYLLLGLLVAGILHVLVPPRIILWALGSRGWRGALKGALLGTPLPLCSCSVLPTAMTLSRRGASKSSAISFMLATPETSVDSLAITAALLPAVFLPVRPIAGVLLAILVGISVEKFSNNDHVKHDHDHDDHCEDHDHEHDHSHDVSDEFCRVCGLQETSVHYHGVVEHVKAIFTYSFKTFFDDIGPWIIGGLVAATLIEIFVPNDFFRTGMLVSNPTIQIILAIVIGIPLYSCATATTPMAAALLLKGLSPGATLAFLLTGPATNIATFFILKREFGGRDTFMYYASMFVVCFLMALGLNAAWPLIGSGYTVIKDTADAGVHLHAGMIETVSAVFILGLGARVLIMRLLKRFSTKQESDKDCCDH